MSQNNMEQTPVEDNSISDSLLAEIEEREVQIDKLGKKITTLLSLQKAHIEQKAKDLESQIAIFCNAITGYPDDKRTVDWLPIWQALTTPNADRDLATTETAERRKYAPLDSSRRTLREVPLDFPVLKQPWQQGGIDASPSPLSTIPLLCLQLYADFKQHNVDVFDAALYKVTQLFEAANAGYERVPAAAIRLLAKEAIACFRETEPDKGHFLVLKLWHLLKFLSLVSPDRSDNAFGEDCNAVEGLMEEKFPFSYKLAMVIKRQRLERLTYDASLLDQSGLEGKMFAKSKGNTLVMKGPQRGVFTILDSDTVKYCYSLIPVHSSNIKFVSEYNADGDVLTSRDVRILDNYRKVKYEFRVPLDGPDGMEWWTSWF